MVEKKKIKIKTKKKKSLKSKTIQQTQNQKAIQKVNINIDPSIIKGKTPIRKKPVNKKNISQNALNAILQNASYPAAQAYELQKLQNDILKRDLKDYIKGRISNVTPPLLIKDHNDSSSYGDVENIKPAKNTVEIEEYDSQYIISPFVGTEVEQIYPQEQKEKKRLPGVERAIRGAIKKIKVIGSEVQPKQEQEKPKRERATKEIMKLRRELIASLIKHGMSRGQAEKQARETYKN